MRMGHKAHAESLTERLQTLQKGKLENKQERARRKQCIYLSVVVEKTCYHSRERNFEEGEGEIENK
jgi:hypothetical protein